MTMGEMIKAARKKAGLTQKELADRLGITNSTISAFERDKTNMKQSTLLKICDALDISLMELKAVNYEKVNSSTVKDITSEIFYTVDYLSDMWIEHNKIDEKQFLSKLVSGLFHIAIRNNFCTAANRDVFLQSLELNDEGNAKILAYTNDLIDSGKYTT